MASRFDKKSFRNDCMESEWLAGWQHFGRIVKSEKLCRHRDKQFSAGRGPPLMRSQTEGWLRYGLNASWFSYNGCASNAQAKLRALILHQWRAVSCKRLLGRHETCTHSALMQFIYLVLLTESSSINWPATDLGEFRYKVEYLYFYIT